MKLPTTDWKKGYMMAMIAYMECQKSIMAEKALTFHSLAEQIVGEFEEKFNSGEEVHA